MRQVKTVFLINDEHYTSEGYGQDAVSAILQKFPTDQVFLVGFLVDNQFVTFKNF